MSDIREYFDSLRGKRIAVIGMGVSNTPLIRMLLRADLDVTVCDRAQRERVEEQAGERGEARAEEQAEPPEQAAQHGKTMRRRRSGEAATPRGVGSGARKAAGGDEVEASGEE